MTIIASEQTYASASERTDSQIFLFSNRLFIYKYGWIGVHQALSHTRRHDRKIANGRRVRRPVVQPDNALFIAYRIGGSPAPSCSRNHKKCDVRTHYAIAKTAAMLPVHAGPHGVFALVPIIWERI